MRRRWLGLQRQRERLIPPKTRRCTLPKSALALSACAALIASPFIAAAEEITTGPEGLDGAAVDSRVWHTAGKASAVVATSADSAGDLTAPAAVALAAPVKASSSPEPAPSEALGEIANATGSPLTTYVQGFASELAKTEHSTVVASLAWVVGIGCAWNGPWVWRSVFVLVVAAMGAHVAHIEAQAWALVPNNASAWLLMAQAAGAAALGVHSGFEGSQVFFGGALGFVSAYCMGPWARTVDGGYHGFALLWYEAGAVTGLLLFTVWRKLALAVLAPLLGAFLVITASGTLVSHFCTFCPAALLRAMPPPEAHWMEAAAVVLGDSAVPSALAAHGCFGLLSLVVYGLSRRRLAAIACLVLPTLLRALMAYTGVGCSAMPANAECPPWLSSVAQWQWPVCCCLLWAGLTAVAAWQQLGLFDGLDPDDFWQRQLAHLGWRPSVAREPGYEVLDPLDFEKGDSESLGRGLVNEKEGDPFKSTLPSGITADPY